MESTQIRLKQRKKNKRSRTLGIIAITTFIIGLSIFYFYSADQSKIRGFDFGNEIQDIQNELKDTTGMFYSNIDMLKEDSITKEEFLTYGELHIKKMEQILEKYDILLPPDAFVSSVKLFKMSTDSQLESDKHLIKSVQYDDYSEKIRAEELLQQSFEYEMAALSLFEEAKMQKKP